MLDALRRRGRALRTPSALLADLGLGRGAQRSVRRLLRELESEGKVERIRGRFRLPRPDGLVEGVYQPRGGAAAEVADDAGTVWRVEPEERARAGDRVLVQPLGGRRAELLRVLDGGRDTWVGIFHRRGGLLWVDRYRDDAEWTVRIARGDAGGAEEGEVVEVAPAVARGRGRARRAEAPEGSPAPPWGRVLRRLGRPGDPEADFAAVVWRRRLPVEFPAEVIAAAEAVAAEPDAEELARRVDLRALDFVTIDPRTARDHDDAVCIERREGEGLRLWVAIADVAHFVGAGSAIDREALRRGNSVYFPDRAIPMLPERLSGDVCSLRPGSDRLVMVVELDLDAGGRVVRRGCYPGVIRSRARLVYEEVAPVMERKDARHPQAALLAGLAEAAARLRRRRLRGGSIDFDLPAAEIVLDRTGHPIDVRRAARTVAHRAIEEAMLAANRAVAELLAAADVPVVHRNHEPPAPDDAAELAALFEELGVAGPELREGLLTPRDVARALARLEGHPAAAFANLAALRAMKLARYGAESLGHFALAFERYVHFTSPIRRYADLVVHRVLRDVLAGDPVRLTRDRAERIAARTSFCERVGVDAEREMADLKKCAFLQRYVGAELEGAVSGVAPHGLYLTLDRWPIEGLVHVATLPEYMVLDERAHALVAERSGTRYRLGDRLRVRLVSVDPVRAHIDFEILEVLEGVGPRAPR